MRRLPCGLSIGLVLLATEVWAQTKAPTDEDPPLARFKVEEVANRADASPGTNTFAASFGTGEAQARFLIEVDASDDTRKAGGGAEPVFSFFKGRFRHVAGSHPEPFLTEVAKALGAKAPKMSQTKAEIVPFEMALLGAHLSHDPLGGFKGTPAGNWVATKLFLADGKAEVYFNFETTSGDAEFSPKDEEYGTLVVEELSKVLW